MNKKRFYQYQIHIPLDIVVCNFVLVRRDTHVNLKVSSKDAYIDEG